MKPGVTEVISEDVVHHLHVPDKLKILKIVR